MSRLNNSQVKLTLEGFGNIENQIRILKIKSKKLEEQMEEIALGTSTLENSEFFEMKSERFFLNEEIERLERLLEKASLAKDSEASTVDIGTKVKISNHVIGHIFNIVDGVEADSSKGKVSVQSPLGKALLGKSKGDKVLVRTPGGQVDFEIMEIS
jgi:transcription elongation factor GreA